MSHDTKPTRGAFLVFEGIDGCGKTTQLHLLAAELRERGFPVWVTSEPSDGYFGRELRRCLGGKEAATGRRIGELFALDRAAHVTRILRALENGTTVVSDRYFLSSLAYQGACMTAEELTALNAPSLARLLPDLTVYCDLSPEEASRRTDSRGQTRELFEKLETQKAVYARYADAIEKRRGSDHIAVVDASGTQEAVYAAVRRLALRTVTGEQV